MRSAVAAGLLRSRSWSAPLALVVLAEARLRQSALYLEQTNELNRDFGDLLAQIDEFTRLQIERAYRADRGASLLRETFGVDVAEIDAVNERLGGATEEELRRYLLDVQQYCARGEPTAAT